MTVGPHEVWNQGDIEQSMDWKKEVKMVLDSSGWSHGTVLFLRCKMYSLICCENDMLFVQKIQMVSRFSRAKEDQSWGLRAWMITFTWEPCQKGRPVAVGFLRFNDHNTTWRWRSKPVQKAKIEQHTSERDSWQSPRVVDKEQTPKFTARYHDLKRSQIGWNLS